MYKVIPPKSMPPNLKEYLRIQEAAEVLGVNPMTLRRWDSSGKLPALRHPISGYRLYSKPDLEAILQTLQTQYSEISRTIL